MGVDADRVATRLARGCRAFAVLHEGRIVSYGWLSTGPEWIGEVGVEISPGAGEAYVWNCLTLAEHRRRGHYRALLEGIVAQARREKLTRLWIGSIDDPAEKADADVGFVPVLHLEAQRFAVWRLVRVTPDAEADRGLVEEARRRTGLTSSARWARIRSRVH
jgi:GNAT superfamily N-acetyltransferase